MSETKDNRKALSKLNRSELLGLLLETSRRNEELEQRIAELEAALADRTIALNKAGSIAEASLQINGVFVAAEKAASQWLENIMTLDKRCSAIEADAERQAAELISDAEWQANQLIADAKEQVAEIVFHAKQQAEDVIAQAKESAKQVAFSKQIESGEYWSELSTHLESFYAEHPELRDLITTQDETQSTENPS